MDNSIIIVCMMGVFVPLIFAFYMIGKRDGAKEVAYDLKDYLKEKGYSKHGIEKFFEELGRIRRKKNL